MRPGQYASRLGGKWARDGKPRQARELLDEDTRAAIEILTARRNEAAATFPNETFTWLESAICHLHGYRYPTRHRASVLYPEPKAKK
jgi:hypothetical protein